MILEDCRILSSIKNIGMADIVQQSKIYFMLKPYNFIFPQMFINKCKLRFSEPYCHYFIILPAGGESSYMNICISMSRGFSLYTLKNSFIQVTETNQSNIICNVDYEFVFAMFAKFFFYSGSIICCHFIELEAMQFDYKNMKSNCREIVVV